VQVANECGDWWDSYPRVGACVWRGPQGGPRHPVWGFGGQIIGGRDASCQSPASPSRLSPTVSRFPGRTFGAARRMSD